jgi:lipopolysaccharide/colanic/teichoic acid biosynthesis glycosyltransferase
MFTLMRDFRISSARTRSEDVDKVFLIQGMRTKIQQAGRAMEARDSGLPRWKRALDVLLVLIFLPAWVLVAGVVALVVKIGSPGPALFRQQRVGYKGRQFTCLKFRTMHVNAETSSHRGYTTQLIKSEVPMTKLDVANDPRLIPFGAKLRAMGLDELPQLINVLRGEMSLVGPRPCIPYEYEMYEAWQRRRFDAAPGLTGLWQVSGKNRTTFSQMIHLDIEYSQRANLWLDLKIILKTVPALITQCCEQRASSIKRNETSAAPSAGAKPARPIPV